MAAMSTKLSFNSSENTYKDHLYTLIICGGAGTRLWPRSREKTPKQFLKNFYGETSLFSQTVERSKLLTSNEKIFVVTLADYTDEILQQSSAILPQNIIVEPFGRNTAMAVGIGAAYIRKKDPKAVILNFWSDAAIRENKIFSKDLNLAAKVAFENPDKLVVVGLKPTFPHTGLGYIETGEAFLDKVFQVVSFKEKPDLPTAEEFIKKGNYYWNTGIYVWSVKALFEAFNKYSPIHFQLLEKISQDIGSSSERKTIEEVYTKAENISIDVAVSEKAQNLCLVLASFGWSDVGDWKVAYEIKRKDENGNVIENLGKKGWHLGIETSNCLIESQDRLVATVGVENLIIIDTEDALLVCSREKSQDVKKIVNILKEKNKKEYL